MIDPKTLGILLVALFLAALANSGCGPKPPPIPPVSGGASSTGGAPSYGGQEEQGGDGPVSPCQLACANLERLRCPEDGESCVGQCELHSRDGRFLQNIDCRINAKTKSEAQLCGPASCRE